MPSQQHPLTSSLWLVSLSEERDLAMRSHSSYYGYSCAQKDNTGALASVTVIAMTSHN